MQTKENTKIKDNKLEEYLKEKILSHEEKKNYSSDRFIKIEEKVKKSLQKQDSDEALRAITIWALVLWVSDIHYECYEENIIVRFRLDGLLVDIFNFSEKEYKAVIERIKYSSGLKLNITNIPQDWKYSLKIDDKKIDTRVSTLPTKYWENMVCRILDSDKAIVDFEQLWFFWTWKRILEKSIQKKNGLILVTGPTWSWKTTTLYTLLDKLNIREKKITTLEDPIEYEMPWIIQSEVDESAWFTFKNWLRALLRQDPDIIMVWEIRDYETLEIATSASLTGHLVLSTLHTKSAADTLDRMINMWLKPYILASALDTIIAQRLVRKICPHCKIEKKKTPGEISIIKSMMEGIGMKWLPLKTLKLYEWSGCLECNNSGYKW